MFDNINIHKGRSRHVRLKQSVTPVMWNFPVRAALKPDLSASESLWKEPKAATEPQKLLSEFTVENLLIGTAICSEIYNIIVFSVSRGNRTEWSPIRSLYG